MSLDQRGDISIALIIIYSFVALGTIFLALRHGFKHEDGWLILILFSLIRIAGGISDIIAEESSPPSRGAYTAAFVLQSAGAPHLLFATVTFLVQVVSVTKEPIFLTRKYFVGLVELAIVIALTLAIVGGVKASDGNVNETSNGDTLRKVGSIVLAGAFVFVALQHAAVWSRKRSAVLAHRWTLLTLCTLALPFLAVRVAYSVASSFAPFPDLSNFGVVKPSTGGVAEFNVVTGKWQIYLLMGVIMELIVVLIYVVGGLFFINKKIPNDSYDYGVASAGQKA